MYVDTLQVFNVIATPIRQAQAASYIIHSQVLDINHLDVSTISLCPVYCAHRSFKERKKKQQRLTDISMV